MRSSVEGKTYETSNLLFGGTRGATNITVNGEAKDNDDEGRQATALARYSGVFTRIAEQLTVADSSSCVRLILNPRPFAAVLRAPLGLP